ncbi:MAG: phenylalanine--tRNA ligase alpha subunit [Candidatus Parcubacteria bacterium]|nr:MAG: phenylalanine--tRNA ligase alpha subunit [Candidatus Parcubacteria bacterium]
MSLEETLNKIWQEAEKEFTSVKSLSELENLLIKYLGRKSYLANFPSLIKKLEIEEKRKIGSLYNELKRKIENLYRQKKEFLLETNIKFDFEHPGREIKVGKEHLISQTINKIFDIFIQLGFSVVDYAQIVDEKENFDYLNIPPHHPARDLWDTLWVKNRELLFRTHTSCFQVPVLKKYGVPIRAIIAGKVFRYEAIDKTHDFEFYQLDGISISENSNLGHLKYVVEKFFERFFKENLPVRFRPGYFPFVEPGLEIDIGCIFCKQRGCIICKKTGFIEVAGAGMVHDFVLKSAGIDYKKYQGYAFGFGVDRLIMLEHGIDDIRILHSSDLRFIRQF